MNSNQSSLSASPLRVLLLCLDLQPSLLNAIGARDTVQHRCAFAIQAAVGLGLDVLFTEQAPTKLGGTSSSLLALAPTGRVLPKTTFSALADSAIREAVVSNQAEHLLLCGIETSVCVYQTALDALAADLQVTIFSDCVAARRTDDAGVCIAALMRAGVHVLPSETVFYSLVHDTSHPFFKPYTQLVKAYT